MLELVRDYLVKVTGRQVVDGEEDVIKIETTGHYEEKDGVQTVCYSEYVEDENGGEERRAIIRVENSNLISVIRDGEYRSQLILELDRQHQCLYQTPYGGILVKVYTNLINIDINKDGGTIRVSYSLNLNNSFNSDNEFLIEFARLEGNKS